MIDHRLSDSERTLLSAYLDDEVSAVERGMAEKLLAGSEEARTYLSELRAVNQLSVEAFPPPMVGGVGGSFSAAISGSGISAATSKVSMLKEIFSSSWGMAGMAATAVVAVVTFALSTSGPTSTGVGVGDSGSARTAHRSEPVIPAVDTSILVVPSMTPAELVGFAVQGTLPIDNDRDRFLTIRPKGADSFAINVSAKAPAAMKTPLRQVDLASFGSLDTMQQEIRGTVRSLGNGAIALRQDFLWQRHRLIDALQSRMPALPMELHAPLLEARRRLEAVPVVNRYRNERRPSAPRSETQGMGMLQVDDESVYNIIIADGQLRKFESRPAGAEEDSKMEFCVPAVAFDPAAQHAPRFMLTVEGEEESISSLKFRMEDFNVVFPTAIAVASPDAGAPMEMPRPFVRRRNNPNVGVASGDAQPLRVVVHRENDSAGEEFWNSNKLRRSRNPWYDSTPDNNPWNLQLQMQKDLEKMFRQADEELRRADSIMRETRKQMETQQQEGEPEGTSESGTGNP